MTEIKIEDGIPIPEDAGRMGRKPKYPLGDMKPGQSIAVNAEEGNKLRNAANSYRKRHEGWGYVGKKVGKVYRLWRIS